MLATQLSTKHLPARRYLDFWVEMAHERFGCQFDPASTANVGVDIQVGELGGCLLYDCSFRNLEHLRRCKAQARKKDGIFSLVLSVENGFRLTGDSDLVTTPGDLSLQDMGRPLDIGMGSQARFMGLAIDETRLAARLRNPRHLSSLAGGTWEGRLVGGYLRSLVQAPHPLPKAQQAPIVDNLLDLLAITLGPNSAAQEAWETEGAPRTRLALVRSHLRRHMADPGLTPAKVAAHFRISVRYLHKLFDGSGQTFSEHLTACRLEAAERLLRDPAQMGRGIADIAFSCGFNDLSHFGRRYRARYGMTPREARASV